MPTSKNQYKNVNNIKITSYLSYSSALSLEDSSFYFCWVGAGLFILMINHIVYRGSIMMCIPPVLSLSLFLTGLPLVGTPASGTCLNKIFSETPTRA